MRAWYSMKAEGKTGEITIYDVIGASFWNEDAVSAKQFDKDLKALGEVDKIVLRINSPGGDVFDGIAIHNMLKNHKAKVEGRVDGIAASAASLVLMAADEIVMPSNAFLLIHGASGMAWGQASEMRKLADDLDRINTSATAVYATRSGQKAQKITDIMTEDRLMAADEAKELGLCDTLEKPVKLAAHFTTEHLPKSMLDKLKEIKMETTAAPAPPPGATVEGEGGRPDGGSPPPSGETTNVVELKKEARAAGAAEHATYVNEVIDLCALAGKPMMAAKFIKDKAKTADVRAKLQEARAEDDEADGINPHRQAQHTTQQQTTAATWDKVLERMTGRFGPKASKT